MEVGRGVSGGGGGWGGEWGDDGRGIVKRTPGSLMPQSPHFGGLPRFLRCW